MSELNELYQEMILEHSKKPKNFHPLDRGIVKEGFNPLCGDKLKLYVDNSGNIIRDISFEGAGCAIFTASASMMTEAVKGKTKSEAEKIFNTFHSMLSGGKEDTSKLGKLEVFSGVNEFPVRVKCATLPWHTLNASLNDSGQEIVSTE